MSRSKITRREALLLPLLAGNCLAGRIVTIRFRWMGHNWKALYEYTLDEDEEDDNGFVGFIDSNGTQYTIGDPNLPFKLDFRDGTYTPVPLGAPPPNQPPSRSAIVPGQVYFLDLYSKSQIRVFNQQTGRQFTTFPVPDDPQGITLNPDGSRLFITHLEILPGNPLPANPPRITVWDTTTFALLQTVTLPAGKVPRKPTFSPDGSRLYIPNSGTPSSVLILDPQSGALLGEIPLGITNARADQLVVTPDGSMIYTATIQQFPAPIVAIDVASASVIGSLNANVSPNSLRHMITDWTGTRLYAATPNRVLIYDTATFAEIARIDWSVSPRLNRLALSFDGGTLFANHEFSRAVTPIDTATLQAGEPIGDSTKLIDGSFMMMVPLGPSAP